MENDLSNQSSTTFKADNSRSIDIDLGIPTIDLDNADLFDLMNFSDVGDSIVAQSSIHSKNDESIDIETDVIHNNLKVQELETQELSNSLKVIYYFFQS